MTTRANCCVARYSKPRCILILWLRPLRLASLRELAYAETLRWFSRLLRSVRLWRMNNALQRIYSTDTPFTGALHPARSINQCSLNN
jgi:hypothetical protein